MEKIESERLFLSQEEVKLKTFKRIEEVEDFVNSKTIPVGFEIDEEGLWFLEDGKNKVPKREWVCSLLFVTGYTRDEKNQNHGRILEFKDIDNYKHIWPMPMDLLSSDGGKILGVLWGMGLQISTKRKAKEKLLEYITRCTPIQRARIVMQTGWHEGLFVLPNETVGYISKERVIYQNLTNTDSKLEILGSLIDWKKNIASKAIGNSRLILAISSSFSASLLHLMNHENIGVHYRGNSSLGKSTAEYVANSVWGGPSGIQTFRATSNGLEGIASLHNDRLLCLDELGQISSLEAGHVIYMLGNGLGKGRANNLGLAKKPAKWRLIFLSTGELSLSQLMNEVGKKIKAGQEVRFIDIPADTGVHGLFENLHEFDNGAHFSKYLQDASKKYYGAASRDFLRSLVEDLNGSVIFLKGVINELEKLYLPKNASAQVIRVFNHLSLIAAGGELATKFEITGWEKDEASKGVIKCFNDWLSTKGNCGLYEERGAIIQVRSFFELHGESRFSQWNQNVDDNIKTNNRVGFRKSESNSLEFYVFKEAFRGEICKGLDYRFVEKILIKQGCLITDCNGNPTRSEKLPGYSSTFRCYKFGSEILNI